MTYFEIPFTIFRMILVYSAFLGGVIFTILLMKKIFY